MTTRFALIAGLASLLLATPVHAQLGLGGVQVDVPVAQDLPGDLPSRVLDPALEITDNLSREVFALAEDRLRRIDRLVRRNRDAIERDARGEPARRGEVVLLNASEEQVSLALAQGYSVIERRALDGLGLTYTRLRLPSGTDLEEAERDLVERLPEVEVMADNLYFQSGLPGPVAHRVLQEARSPFNRGGEIRPASVAMIDGAPMPDIEVLRVEGFAVGAGTPSDHGSAVASLLRAQGVTRITVADVYGTDPAGGNAVAIARALDRLSGGIRQVITISLVGPDNPLVARAIAAVQRRGHVVVAAVGNDGRAAPPAYPASYPNVVAVTGVDRRERALIEAGRALHLDYAAPGADIYGLDRRGRNRRLRGTSYAAPLVAARIAFALGGGANWRNSLDSEAHDLGERGPDETYGRGLICRGCGMRE